MKKFAENHDDIVKEVKGTPEEISEEVEERSPSVSEVPGISVPSPVREVSPAEMVECRNAAVIIAAELRTIRQLLEEKAK